jgi:CheY-like chemotaxis protein
MSNTQDGFLGKVSKGIKKRIFDDEPNAVSDSLLIGRLQSLADTESSSRSKKAVEPMPYVIDTTNAQKLLALEPATAPPVTAGDLAVELAIEQAPSPNRHQDTSFADTSSASDGTDPIKTSRSLATILVVEDEIVTRKLMKKILEGRGYEVVASEDGVEALMAIGKMKFDLILCDINMPYINGFKLMEFLNQKKISIPFIFITVHEDVEDEITGLALGAKDYIRKPVNSDLLLLRIRKALDK